MPITGRCFITKQEDVQRDSIMLYTNSRFHEQDDRVSLHGFVDYAIFPVFYVRIMTHCMFYPLPLSGLTILY